MNSTEFSKLYDHYFEAFDKLLKEFNPCRIHDNNCWEGRLLDTKGFCCGGCKFLTKGGCRVKAVGCKSWLCSSVRANLQKENPTFMEKWRNLEDEFFWNRSLRKILAHPLHPVHPFRKSKGDAMKIFREFTERGLL